MTVEDALKGLILERYGTMAAFAQVVDMSPSTLHTIFLRGLPNANVTNIIKICKTLNISTDELAEGRIVTVNEIPHQQTEISDLMSERKMRDTIFTLDGTPLTEEERKLFQYALEMAAHQIRRSR